MQGNSTFDFWAQIDYNFHSFDRPAYPWEEQLANLKSSIKRIRSSRRKAGYNQITRSTARTHVKKARLLIQEGKLDEAREVVHQAIRALDRAAQKKVIHRNNAARRKSRLVKELNQALQA